jgi:hypothetical protein
MKGIAMKLKHWFAAGVAGALTLILRTASAQSWQTVDDFQYVAGQDAGNASLAIAPNGTLFAAGWGFDLANSHGLVMASSDGGVSWSGPLDDFTGGGALYVSYNGAACDAAGNVYAAGYYSGDGPNHWLLRCSIDSGATWATIDDYYDGGWETAGNAVAVDAAGNVYVAGYSTGQGLAAGAQHWVIRKGIVGGNFSTVDFVPCAWGVGAAAIRVHPTAGVFAAGVGPISTNKTGQVTYGWIVRRSTNGGTTWATVDKFNLADGYNAAAFGIGSDTHGNLYVVGSADSVAGTGRKTAVYAHWVVRKSSDGGNSWSTVDNTLSSTGLGFETAALGFAADSNGNLFAVGQNLSDWVVRENPGGIGTWQTVDNFKYSAGANAAAIAADASGHVFVGGYGWNNTDFTDHWLVRKH